MNRIAEMKINIKYMLPDTVFELKLNYILNEICYKITCIIHAIVYTICVYILIW